MPVHFIAVAARKVATREPGADRLLCIRRRLGVSDCDVFEARRERLSGDDMMTLREAPTAQVKSQTTSTDDLDLNEFSVCLIWIRR